MKWSSVNDVVESLRRETLLYLPALSKRRGFSSDRVEHLLDRLVRAMPHDELYLEVGVLEGRTLEAASVNNPDKLCLGVDPCFKYDAVPGGFPSNVLFYQTRFEDFHLEDMALGKAGVVFYDGDHSAESTSRFMGHIEPALADEAVLVLDDWDRVSVREGAYDIFSYSDRWQLLREMPEWTDGLTTTPHYFGYHFGVSVWGFRR